MKLRKEKNNAISARGCTRCILQVLIWNVQDPVVRCRLSSVHRRPHLDAGVLFTFPFLNCCYCELLAWIWNERKRFYLTSNYVKVHGRDDERRAGSTVHADFPLYVGRYPVVPCSSSFYADRTWSDTRRLPGCEGLDLSGGPEAAVWERWTSCL